MKFKEVVSISVKANDLLKETRISTLLEHKRKVGFHPLVSLNENTSIREALVLLLEKNILAAPIFKIVEKEEKVYTGIMSIYDILSFSVFQKIFDSNVVDLNENKFIDQVDQLQASDFFHSPIKKLLGANNDSTSPWIVNSTDPLTSLLSLFTTHKQHRALVIDSDILFSSVFGPIPPSASLRIVTQTDLVKFLYESRIGGTTLAMDYIEPLFNLNYKQVSKLLDHESKPLIAMLDSQSALHGFRTMYIDKLSAIPIVTEEGTIVATLSASNLRGLTMDNISTLVKPVLQYLKNEVRDRDSIKPDQVCSIDEEQTVENGVALMVKQKIHRVWVTGSANDLAGVLSLTDVLSLFSLTQ
ncbi:hypothetical protein BC833DRAFT_568401 [Globomyces pollinis-pini]|nr:hypothetical protein BC833DRAFT_568401 [Globomyces pollinis-pini]KAJ2995258.1 hypothetical protein HDV02_000913 [Globomyces sp. JEL0801]